MMYRIDILRPAPSMSQDHIVFEAADYREAVNRTRKEWAKVQRPVTLCNEPGVYFWHRISKDTRTREWIATDRNTNNGFGIPEYEVVVAEVTL